MTKMMLCACLLLAMAGAMAFVVPSTPVSVAQTRTQVTSMMQMSAGSDFQKGLGVAAASLVTAAPAFAAEGTGLSFGVDNNLLLVIPISIIVAINLIFFQWAGNQPDNDFFSEYDQRRK